MSSRKARDPCRVALVASYGLGDAVLLLQLRNTLLMNGYSVDFYSSHVSQLQEWLSDAPIHPFPSDFDPQSFHRNFDIVIADHVSFITKAVQPSASLALAQRYVFFSLCGGDKQLFSPQTHEQLRQNLPQLPHDLVSLGIRLPRDNTHTIAQKWSNACRAIGMQVIAELPGLQAPANLTFRKEDRRVLLHPTSSCDEKNWGVTQFNILANALRSHGYETEFICAPWEHERCIRDHGTARTFQSIDGLARFMYESGALIGNDSGNVHLASALGIPNIAIVRKRAERFFWRQCWEGRQVSPVFSGRVAGKRIWRPFLGINRVLKGFLDYMADYRVGEKP